MSTPNCCMNCKWLDGFTGECLMEVDTSKKDGFIDIYKDPCPNPIYFVCGEGHCIDQHDVWRDGEFHQNRIVEYKKWKLEAKAHKQLVEGKSAEYTKIITLMDIPQEEI